MVRTRTTARKSGYPRFKPKTPPRTESTQAIASEERPVSPVQFGPDLPVGLGLGVFVIEGEEQVSVDCLVRHGYQIWPANYTLGGELLNSVPPENQECLKLALWIYVHIVSGRSTERKRLIEELEEEFETVIPGFHGLLKYGFGLESDEPEDNWVDYFILTGSWDAAWAESCDLTCAELKHKWIITWHFVHNLLVAEACSSVFQFPLPDRLVTFDSGIVRRTESSVPNSFCGFFHLDTGNVDFSINSIAECSFPVE
jgi:hypothetical protein